MSLRPIMATFTRPSAGHSYLRSPAYYARVSSAFPRAIAWLVLYGQPGDTVQLVLRDYGTVFAEARIKVGGDFVIHLTKE